MLAFFSMIEPDKQEGRNITQVKNKGACKINPYMVIEQKPGGKAMNNTGDKGEEPYPVGINYLPHATAFFQVMAAIGGNLRYKMFQVAQQEWILSIIKRYLHTSKYYVKGKCENNCHIRGCVSVILVNVLSNSSDWRSCTFLQ